MKILLHTYTLREHPFEDVVAFARSTGFDGLEIHMAHFNPARVETELAARMGHATVRDLPSLCMDFKADLINADAAVRETAAGLLRRQVETAARCGMPMLNGFTGFLTGADPADFRRNGSAIATDAHYARCAELLRPVARLAEDLGPTLLLEVHMNTIHDTLAATQRLIEAVGSPALQATLDPGNSIATRPADLDAATLKAFMPHVGHVHLKNARVAGEWADYSVGLAEGDVNVAAFLKQLKQFGYTGVLSLEYVGEGDPEAALISDLAYVRDVRRGLRDGAYEDFNGR